jgi:putative tricarboxylic transport membrane protein
MAVLLGAFTFHGLQVGPAMLTDDLDILMLLVLALLLSNIFTSILGLLFSLEIAKITQIPVERLIPIILVVSIIGAFAIRNNPLDVIVAIAFGFGGYVMIAYDYSRIAVILALILSPIAERQLFITFQAYDSYAIFFTRPISLILVVLIILTIALPRLRSTQTSEIITEGGDQ